MIRPLLMVLTLLGASFVTFNFSAHHTGENAFQTLYMHLVPAPLVTHGEHGHATEEEHAAGHEGEEHAGTPMVRIPLPGFLAAFDYDQSGADGVHLVLYNLQVFQVAAVILILIGFSGVPRYLRTGQGDGLTRVLAGFCHYVRDEMVVPNVGREHGEKLLPLFLSIFFFILFMNLAGLVPGAVTATASIFVTAALSLITLACMIGGGMLVQGPLAYWKNLVPHVPFWLWPLLFVVELIGVAVKPFALTVRLFANMTGGHMVVLSFMGLIFYFGQNTAMFGEDSAKFGLMVSPIAVGFGVFIMIIEVFVAMLQAYIFTQLSVIFIGASVHPEH